MKDLWVSLSGAIAQQKNVETIANNVANANTPGFKKDQLVFKEYLTAFEKGHQDIDLPNKEWSPEDFYKSYGAENSFVKVDGAFTIHKQGQLSPTGNPLDIGLQGDGFLEVLTPNGIRYTRKGNFTIGKDGSIVTDNGHKVLSRIDWSKYQNVDTNSKFKLPKERQIYLPPGRISVNLQGQIFSAGKPVGELSLVEFKDVHALRKEGNSMFINKNIENIIKDWPKTATHQGFIEQSNVNAIQEMSELLKANRQFESIQRAIKTYDNIAGKSVNEIAKF